MAKRLFCLPILTAFPLLTHSPFPLPQLFFHGARRVTNQPLVDIRQFLLTTAGARINTIKQ
jgi:hypothetical protein